MDCDQTVPNGAVGSGFIVFASMMKVPWPQGYKTFFMLSAEHNIYPGHKC